MGIHCDQLSQFSSLFLAEKDKSNRVDTGRNIFAIFHYGYSRAISGKHKLITIAFNPSVLEQFGRDSALTTERRLLINLAIDYIQVFEHCLKTMK